MQKLKLNELGRLNKEEFKEANKNDIILVLDNVRSLNNVGSMFRTADAFLVKKMYLCGITGIPPHREITKTAIGAENTIDWEYAPSVISIINNYKKIGYSVVSLEQTSKSQMLNKFKWHAKTVLVVGNEVDGVDLNVLNISDYAVEIPQLGTKHSLNVSVSCGIALWDLAVKNKLIHEKV